ncbi:MAG: hypothetical protein EOP45_12845, partial [Sphingobacteriaceae bacterium]
MVLWTHQKFILQEPGIHHFDVDQYNCQPYVLIRNTMDAEETRLYYILWIAMVLMGVIIFYFFYKMTRNQSQTLKAMREQLDMHLKKSDEDRIRMAGELHDDIQPYLTVLSQNLQLMGINPADAGLLRQESVKVVD